MDNISLHKLISKLILRKYKWIVDCQIDTFYNSPIEKYTVIYYTDSPYIGDIEDEVNQVEKITQDLFRALGPGSYQSLQGVNFYYDIKKLTEE